MQRMLAEVVVPETTTRFIETQITNKSLTNILWNILLSILLGLTGQSDLTHLRLVTQPVSRMLSSASVVWSLDLLAVYFLKAKFGQCYLRTIQQSWAGHTSSLWYLVLMWPAPMITCAGSRPPWGRYDHCSLVIMFVQQRGTQLQSLPR